MKENKLSKNLNLSDIEIQRATKVRKINTIAKKLNLKNDDLELYGKYIAKINAFEVMKNYPNKKGKVILVTAINPTSAGEGKTTVSIGLNDGLNIVLKKTNKNSLLALREPSLGPVFGIKGGATGGGYAQVYPMENINLHFTGDFHAITTANNLLASLIDNHIFQGNDLQIDPEKIVFNRCLDLNDRALRDVIVRSSATGKETIERKEKFNITAASEVMAILSLSKDLDELKENLGNIIIGYSYENKAIYAKDLKAHDAMTIVLKEAIKPNLVQSLEGNPVLIHCGPFANIAHGCNSIIATSLARHLGDYVVTEAGFGADLGAEKFIDIKCRKMNIMPECIVLVATVKALKLHGKQDTNDFEALRSGLSNIKKHINSITNVYKLPVVISINEYKSDTKEEISLIKNYCLNLGCEAICTKVWEKGGKGAIELAKTVLNIVNNKLPSEPCFAYDLEYKNKPIETKIEKIAKSIYGASDVLYSSKALNSLQNIYNLGLENLCVCLAKTQYSLSDDPKKLFIDESDSTTAFNITINDIEIRNGSKMLVAIAGNMLLMPGLSKTPQAEKMTIENNIINGLM